MGLRKFSLEGWIRACIASRSNAVPARARREPWLAPGISCFVSSASSLASGVHAGPLFFPLCGVATSSVILALLLACLSSRKHEIQLLEPEISVDGLYLYSHYLAKPVKRVSKAFAIRVRMILEVVQC